MWIRNTFFHKNNASTKEIIASTQIQQHNISFLAGDSIFFFQQQNLIHFCSARALNYFKKDKKMLAAFPLKKFHPLA